jgi:hypothetical protein
MSELKPIMDYLMSIAVKSKSDLEFYFDGDCHRPDMQWHVIIRYPVSYKSSPADNWIGADLEECLLRLKEKAHKYLLKPNKDCKICEGTGFSKEIIFAEHTEHRVGLCDCNFPEFPLTMKEKLTRSKNKPKPKF